MGLIESKTGSLSSAWRHKSKEPSSEPVVQVILHGLCGEGSHCAMLFIATIDDRCLYDTNCILLYFHVELSPMSGIVRLGYKWPRQKLCKAIAQLETCPDSSVGLTLLTGRSLLDRWNCSPFKVDHISHNTALKSSWGPNISGMPYRMHNIAHKIQHRAMARDDIILHMCNGQDDIISCTGKCS